MKWTRIIIVIAVLAIIVGATLLPFAQDLGDWRGWMGLLLISGGLLLLIPIAIILIIIRGYPRRVWRYLWATKYRRLGFTITAVIIIIIAVLTVMWVRNQATLNILHYDGTEWSQISSGTEERLFGIWGSSASDVFAVGDKGIILHYDGITWNQMHSGTQESLIGIWGTSSSDVFAVGVKGIILHYDGHVWRQMISDTRNSLVDIWGNSANDIFAVGNEGTIMHYDGHVWRQMRRHIPQNPEYIWDQQNLLDIWGSSSSDVFAVGMRGTLDASVIRWCGAILHYDGNAWNEMNIGTTASLSGVFGSSPSNVYAVGDESTIMHYNGHVWSKVTNATNSFREFQGVWGSSSSEIFILGIRRK